MEVTPLKRGALAGRRARLTEVSLLLLESEAFVCAERVLILLEVTPLKQGALAGRRARLTEVSLYLLESEAFVCAERV